jgi:hypothetical protein
MYQTKQEGHFLVQSHWTPKPVTRPASKTLMLDAVIFSTDGRECKIASNRADKIASQSSFKSADIGTTLSTTATNGLNGVNAYPCKFNVWGQRGNTEVTKMDPESVGLGVETEHKWTDRKAVDTDQFAFQRNDTPHTDAEGHKVTFQYHPGTRSSGIPTAGGWY